MAKNTTSKLKLVKDTEYILDVKDGFVDALLKSGNDYVVTKVEEDTAKQFLAKGKVLLSSPMKDYPICVEYGKIWCLKGKVKGV